MNRLLVYSLKFSHLRQNHAAFTIQRSIFACANFSFSQHNYATAAIAAQAIEKVDSKINRLDQFVKKTGRISLRDVQSTLREIQIAGNVSVTQSLMMIRASGSLLVEVDPEARTKLVNEIWKTLNKLNIKLDVSHYNALIQVYLENNHSFAPSDILGEIERKGLEPNRVTYQRLITRYCQMGDIAGATRIMEFMREKGMPTNESVFNSLISGYSEIKDMDNAENILSVMKECGVEPSSETYALLICGYIKNGMLGKVEDVFEKCEKTEVMFTDMNCFDIIYAYAVHGYEQEIDKILNKIRKIYSYNHNATNFVHKLLRTGKHEVAFKIVKTMSRSTRPDGSVLPIGNFFISQLIRLDQPTELVTKYALDLMNENLNPSALVVALQQTLRHGKINSAIALMKKIKENSTIPIRLHYFWPLLVNRGKSNDITGMRDILMTMSRDFDLQPNFETIREYVVPYFSKNDGEVKKLLLELKSCGIQTSLTAGCIVCHLLRNGKLREASQVASDYNTRYQPSVIKLNLTNAFLKTPDVDSFVHLLQDVSTCFHYIEANREPESEDGFKIDYREYTGEVVEHVVRKLLSTENKNVVEDLLKKIVEAEVAVSEEKIKAIQNLVEGVISSETIASLSKLSEFVGSSMKSKPHKLSLNSLDYEALERVYELTKAKGQEPQTNLKRLLLIAYAKNNQLDKMLKLKEELDAENFVPDVALQVHLLSTYAAHNKIQEALQIYQTLCDADPNFQLNSVRRLNFATVLVQNGEYDKAKEVLQKETTFQSKEDAVETNVTNYAFRLLNKLAEEGNVERLKEFFDLLVSAKLIQVNNMILGPLIRVHINKGDYETALQEFENCVTTYKQTPLKNELTCKFVEKEDATSLQKLTDLSMQVHGEINSLMDLLMAFVECGRIRQARKLLETPGLRLKSDRLDIICDRYVYQGNAEHVNNFLKVTKGVAIIDRASIYEKLLKIYVEQNDAENALVLWEQVQDEDIQASDAFLIQLGELLKKNDVPVPFVIPERHAKSTKKVRDNSVTPRKSLKLKQLIELGDIDGALKLKNNSTLSKSDYSLLIDSLLQKDRYREAKECVVQFFNETQMIIKTKFRLLLFHAVKNGDVDLFLILKDKLKSEFKRKVSFDNFRIRAHLTADRIDEILSEYENKLEEVTNAEDLDRYLKTYPCSGIVDVMCKKPQYVTRIKEFAEKCFTIGESSMMANVLWSYYMCQKEFDEADKIFDKYLKMNDRKMFFPMVLKKIQECLDVELGKKVVSVIKTKKNITDGTFAAIYGPMIESYVERDEIKEGKECLDEALSLVSLDKFRSKSLESLKAACLKKNIPFPYEIPEGTTKRVRSDNSDSDSD